MECSALTRGVKAASSRRTPKRTRVELQLVDGRLVIEPVPEADYALDQLLVGVTAENLHSEIDFSSPEGNEVW